MQQNTPQDSTILTILRVRIDKAKAEHADLYQLQAIAPTPKRAARMENILANLGNLKTLRLRYATEQRYIRVYEQALDTGIWQGKPLGERERADMLRWLESCHAEIAEIEREVNG